MKPSLARTEIPVSRPSAAPANGQAVNILLVDDDARNLDVLESFLQSPDYQVVRAQTSDQALMHLLNEEFAAIVLDIEMPMMSGIELANLIKQRKRTQHIPIIFLTAYFQEDKDVLKGYSIGAVDYLTKPVNPEVLKSKVAVFVELFRKSRALAASNVELQETIDQLEAFSYSVSHDMRAPLRAMRGFSELLIEDYTDNLDPQAIAYLKRINSSAARMDRLIEDLLAYSKVLRADVRLLPTSLGSLIPQIIEFYPQLCLHRDHFHITTPLPVVIAHEASLTQCLSNLLSNAVKFVAPDILPHVKIRSEDAGPDVRLWIEDNGIGIAPEEHERVFGIFERGASAGSYEGTGIGLAIARKSVERMNGRLGLESAPGRGSRFWIQLRKSPET